MFVCVEGTACRLVGMGGMGGRVSASMFDVQCEQLTFAD